MRVVLFAFLLAATASLGAAQVPFPLGNSLSFPASTPHEMAAAALEVDGDIIWSSTLLSTDTCNLTVPNDPALIGVTFTIVTVDVNQGVRSVTFQVEPPPSPPNDPWETGSIMLEIAASIPVVNTEG